MTKLFKYKVLPELSLIVEYFEGQIGLDDLIEFQIRQMEDKSCHPNYDDITDIRNSTFVVLKDDIKKYAAFIKQTEKKHGNRKVAIIADTPDQTAITMLYSSYTENLPLNNKVFSTLDAALKWLGHSLDKYHLVEESLKLLRDGNSLNNPLN